jgi:hypothetical protein
MDTVRISPVSDAAAIRFPRFTEFPKNLHHFSYKNEVFAPRSFALEQTGTPWLLFDDQQRGVVAGDEVSVSPSRERVKERPGNDPVRQAIVSIQGT